MSILRNSPVPLPISCTQWKVKQEDRLLPSRAWGQRLAGISRTSVCFNSKTNSHGNGVISFFFNPIQDPIVKQVLKEPVAFLGGVFAGILRLDLNEEPLKEWVTRTAEAAGISEEVIDAVGSITEAAPQEIEIE